MKLLGTDMTLADLKEDVHNKKQICGDKAFTYTTDTIETLIDEIETLQKEIKQLSEEAKYYITMVANAKEKELQRKIDSMVLLANSQEKSIKSAEDIIKTYKALERRVSKLEEQNKNLKYEIDCQ